MKTQLENLYGQYMQLFEDSDDYLIKQKYKEKLNAIDVLFENMPYGAANPAMDL